MIVVLGRPALSVSAAPGEGSRLAGRAARIAVTAAAAGARVELVGSVGDDPEGDVAVVELGRAGVGHAAILRDPSARTELDEDGRLLERGPRSRLDAADLELGLRYVPECTVLLVADELAGAALIAARDGAAYHGAALVALVAVADDDGAPGWPEGATVIAAPLAGEDADAFEAMVAEYAVRLDHGEVPARAFEAAVRASAWERTGDD